ncbi:MAG: HD domain-containing protein [Lachnospiraceae bacterium]
MERLNQLFHDSEYQQCLQKIKEAEQTRIYCRHDLSHFLDVARLMWIAVLEKHLPYEKEIVYAAAFLHDIGRSLQYGDGTPHEAASVEIAEKLLPKYGFCGQETQFICEGIAGHREQKETGTFAALLYDADKAARSCYACSAQDTCKWSMEKRNLRIER